ncbi:CLCA_X family protein [Marinobacter sp.]|uniref:CLCA_X family protein n=1 Tax=Marinobacter sp. TaxID=50741 RepID=UPI0035C6F5BA
MSISFIHIRRQYDFRNIEIGRWVTEAERDRAAGRFHDALVALMGTLQVPEQVISLKSSLGLQYGIGGQLGVCAHYIPATRQLALAKNAGAGSLAHEWFHAFDHYIASKVFVQPPRQAFASALWLDSQAFKPHPLNTRLFRCFEAILLNEDGTRPSALFEASQRVDNQQQSLYWARPEELCARAFEAFVEDRAPRNTFLVKGSRGSEEARLGLYPEGNQRDRIAEAFSAYFLALGQALARVPPTGGKPH